MFPRAYFCNRMFAPRYFPKVGGTPIVATLWRRTLYFRSGGRNIPKL